MSFRDRPDLYEMTALGDGYVLEGGGALVGYGLDDVERFRIPGDFDTFTQAPDGQLVTVTDQGGVVTVQAWSAAGAALGELGRLEDPEGVLDLADAAILGDGSVLAHGGDWRDFWTGRVSPDGDVLSQSDQERRSGVVAAMGTDAHALRSTWHDEEGTLEHVELMLIGADETPQWTTTIFDRTDTNAPFESPALLASAGGDAFVGTRTDDVASDSSSFTLRRYTPDGEIAWTKTDGADEAALSFGLPVVRRDGSLLWVDRRPEAIRVRFLDDAGGILCEQEIPSHGHEVTDLEIIEDELFVITVDRVTRIRLADP